METRQYEGKTNLRLACTILLSYYEEYRDNNNKSALEL